MKIENVNVHMRAEMDKYISGRRQVQVGVAIDGNRASLQNSDVVICVVTMMFAFSCHGK